VVLKRSNEGGVGHPSLAASSAHVELVLQQKTNLRVVILPEFGVIHCILNFHWLLPIKIPSLGVLLNDLRNRPALNVLSVVNFKITEVDGLGWLRYESFQRCLRQVRL